MTLTAAMVHRAVATLNSYRVKVCPQNTAPFGSMAVTVAGPQSLFLFAAALHAVVFEESGHDMTITGFVSTCTPRIVAAGRNATDRAVAVYWPGIPWEAAP
jgi:hypothetical protein